MKTVEYHYRPNRTSIAISFLFCGALSIGAIVAALNNDRGLIIEGFIHLSKSGATTFFWCLSVLPSVGSVLSLTVLWSSVFRARSIALTESKVAIPVIGFSQRSIEIPFSNIAGLDLTTFGESQYLYVTRCSPASPRIMVTKSYFSSPEAFEEFCRELDQRISRSKG